MSSRLSLQHFISTVAPTNATVGDEWYNSTAKILYKRALNGSGVVDWVEINRFDTTGNRSFVNPTISNYTDQIFSTTVTGNALTVDLNNGRYQVITTMAGANAITLPAPAAGKTLTLQINYVNTPTTLTFTTSTGTIRFPSSVTPTPTLTNAKVDIYVFSSEGRDWYANRTGAAF
jgi:hypothetical protein